MVGAGGGAGVARGGEAKSSTARLTDAARWDARVTVWLARDTVEVTAVETAELIPRRRARPAASPWFSLWCGRGDGVKNGRCGSSR